MTDSDVLDEIEKLIQQRPKLDIESRRRQVEYALSARKWMQNKEKERQQKYNALGFVKKFLYNIGIYEIV